MVRKNHEKVDKNIEIAIDDSSLYLLKNPFMAFCAGGSQSGKTTDILSWLAAPEQVFEAKFSKITYICGSPHQQSFNNPLLRHITFTDDLEILHTLEKTEGGHLVILDDVLQSIADDKNLVKITTQDIHHLNVSIIFLTQTVFYNSPAFRIAKENTQYWMIKNHQNRSKLKLFASQIGLDVGAFMSAYNYIMHKYRFGGILIDLHIKSDIRRLSPFRYGLTKTPSMLISNEDFRINTENGSLKKIGENRYQFKPPVFSD